MKNRTGSSFLSGQTFHTKWEELEGQSSVRPLLSLLFRPWRNSWTAGPSEGSCLDTSRWLSGAHLGAPGKRRLPSARVLLQLPSENNGFSFHLPLTSLWTRGIRTKPVWRRPGTCISQDLYILYIIIHIIVYIIYYYISYLYIFNI